MWRANSAFLLRLGRELRDTYVICISLRQKAIICVLFVPLTNCRCLYLQGPDLSTIPSHIHSKEKGTSEVQRLPLPSVLCSLTFSYISAAPLETFRRPLSKSQLETEGETTALSVRSVIRASRAACCFVPHTNAELSEWSIRSREWNESNFPSLL